LDEFLPKHEIYSRSPDSPWIRLLLVRQRHAAGSNELRGCIWRKRDSSGTAFEELATQSQWLEVLGDVFHEQLVDYAKLERDALWKQVRQAHEEWLRTQHNAAQ
jgi:N-hydroxyarylamine O-acetyltransferase